MSSATTAMYDQINLSVPKEQKALIIQHATASGESINEFIRRAIDELIMHDDIEDEIPNAETIAAINEVDEMIRTGSGKPFSGSTDEFFDMILAEDDDAIA